MPFNVYIGNLAHLDDNTMNNVITVLQGYFSRVANGDNPLGSVQVVNNAPAVTNTDLLCYLVTDFMNSVVISFDSRVTHEEGHAGKTAFRTHPNIAASEVYLSEIDERGAGRPTAIANLIFHELMHNKGVIGNALHRTGGGGLAAAHLSSASTLSDGNIAFMRARMSNAVQQWPEGFDANNWG